MTDFTPGEIVVGQSGTEYEVMFGPYPVFEAPTYLVKNEHGSGVALLASALKRKPADPRRDVVARWLYKDDTGRDDWDSVALPDCLNAYRESAASLLTALDACTPPVRYRDHDGDVWEQQPDGTVKSVENNSGLCEIGDWLTYGAADDLYGPLTRL